MYISELYSGILNSQNSFRDMNESKLIVIERKEVEKRDMYK